uniref:Ataxin-7-like protein 1 n=1 Tax=Amphiprion ocellaris TaxID=80972 RepID=A0AAQ5YS62_AMPOC
MATLDRQIPSPDTFLCEPWSSFVSAAKLRFVDSNQFPTLEDFCLVICRVCSKVVTPQGILTHYGKINRPLRAQKSAESRQYLYIFRSICC